MPPEPLSLVALTAIVTPVIGVFTVVDVLRHPAHRWRVAGRSRRTWLLLHLLLLVVPLLPVVLVYLVRVAPHLRRVARSELQQRPEAGQVCVEVDGRVALVLHDGDAQALEVAPGVHAVAVRGLTMRTASILLEVPPGGLIWVLVEPPAEAVGPGALDDPRSRTWVAVVERTASA